MRRARLLPLVIAIVLGLLALGFHFSYTVSFIRGRHLTDDFFLSQQKFRALFQAKVTKVNDTGSSCGEDPLDDNCPLGLTGFPSKPLSIKEAKLCDEKMHPSLPHNSEVRCEGDPTCVKCRSKEIQNNEALFAAFNGRARKRLRVERLQQWFRKDQPVIVCAVNYGQLFLFLNWANSCIANKVMDPREFIWVIPTDKRAFDLLSKFGFHAEPVDWLADFKVRISENYRGGANIGGHTYINSVTVFAANSLLELG